MLAKRDLRRRSLRSPSVDFLAGGGGQSETKLDKPDIENHERKVEHGSTAFSHAIAATDDGKEATGGVCPLGGSGSRAVRIRILTALRPVVDQVFKPAESRAHAASEVCEQSNGDSNPTNSNSNTSSSR
ncbi:hypothetical protein ZHAS_00004507 [Anopheles sinensis]|uniref:Uncharacterized protein n=1 Tax=Anopheles sinensis TaxID=74873 RepID=A0A084VH46_ANOSI|nr:hypothetical protein ZHAS_00004507 [Anopheles sinensis]